MTLLGSWNEHGFLRYIDEERRYLLLGLYGIHP